MFFHYLGDGNESIGFRRRFFVPQPRRLFVGNLLILQPNHLDMGNFTTYKSHYRSIITLGLPLLLGQLGMILTGFADTLMVGHYSTDALASASFVNNIMNFMTVLCMGFSYGLTPIVGARNARGEHFEVGATVKNAILLNMAFGIAVGAAMLSIYFNVEKLGQPANLIPLIKPYYLVLLASMVPMLFVNTLRQFTDGITDTRLSMWIIIGGNILNIILNYLTIYGKMGFPELGLLGAGLSTLAARMAMAIAYAVVLSRSHRYRRYLSGIKAGRLDTATIATIFATSWPIAVQMGLETGIFSFASIMIGWLGEIPLAAYQIMLSISTIGFLVYYSLGASMSIKIAGYYGAGDIDKIKSCSVAGLHIIMLFAAIACMVFFFLGEPVIKLFTSDVAVISVALLVVPPLMLYQVGDALQVTYANALRGITDVRPMMLTAIVAYLIVGLPLGYLLGFPCGMGIVGIYLSFAVALLLAGIMFFTKFRLDLRDMQAKR